MPPAISHLHIWIVRYTPFLVYDHRPPTSSSFTTIRYIYIYIYTRVLRTRGCDFVALLTARFTEVIERSDRLIVNPLVYNVE